MNYKKWRIFKLISILFIITSAPLIVTVLFKGSIEQVISFKEPISLAWAFVGVCWATLGIVNGLIDLLGKLNIINKSPAQIILDNEEFVNRTDEIRKIATNINKNSISVYGPKGVGKSQLLKFIVRLCCDFKFSKNRIGEGSAKLLSTFQPLYVDLSDCISTGELLEQISIAISGEKNSNMSIWKLLSDYYGESPVLIILDNVNIQASIKECLKIYQLNKNYRDKDRFIFASIEPITDIRSKLITIDIYPFDPSHCREMAQNLDQSITAEEAEKIYIRSNGLPIYISFLANYKNVIHNDYNSFGQYFINEIYSKLSDKEQDQVIMIALINLTTTSIPLLKYVDPMANQFASDIRALNKYSIFIWLNNFSGQYFKLHDLIRDIVLQNKKEEIPLYSSKVHSFIENSDSKSEIVYQLLSVPHECKVNESTLVEKLMLLRESASYPLIMGMWDIIENYSTPESTVNCIKRVRDDFLYSYLFALLGTGDYNSAEKLSGSKIFQSVLPNRQKDLESKISFNIKYSLADMDHLLNRYTTARESIHLLSDECKSKGWTEEFIQCKWLECHLTGHLGDNILPLAQQYKNVANQATGAGYPILSIKCLHGCNSIYFTMTGVDDIKLDDLTSLLAFAENSGANKALISGIYSNLSRFFRLSKDYESSEIYLHKSLKLALECGARTYINCEFSKAEILRFRGNFKEAILSYDTVIKETTINQDKNLLTSAMYGKIISAIYNSKNIANTQFENYENDIVFIERVSEQYSMFITTLRCKILRHFFSHNKNSEYKSLYTSLGNHGLRRDQSILSDIDQNLQFIEIHVN